MCQRGKATFFKVQKYKTERNVTLIGKGEGGGGMGKMGEKD